jgi:hypothetical protein
MKAAESAVRTRCVDVVKAFAPGHLLCAPNTKEIVTACSALCRRFRG